MLIVQFTEVNPHILNTGRCKLAQSDFNKAVTGNVTSGFVSLVVMVMVAAVVGLTGRSLLFPGWIERKDP